MLDGIVTFVLALALGVLIGIAFKWAGVRPGGQATAVILTTVLVLLVAKGAIGP